MHQLFLDFRSPAMTYLFLKKKKIFYLIEAWLQILVHKAPQPLVNFVFIFNLFFPSSSKTIIFFFLFFKESFHFRFKVDKQLSLLFILAILFTYIDES